MIALRSLWRRRVNQALRPLCLCPPSGIRCLVYHILTPQEDRDPGQMKIPLQLFESHLAYLSENGYRVISCSELVRRVRSVQPAPAKTVAISFDDGEASLHSLAFPILRKYRFPATVFCVAEAQGETTLTWQQARHMRESGLVEFGCHGATHRRLRGLSDRELVRETACARDRMESELGCKISLFAYPYGAYGAWDNRLVRALREAGFEGAFTSVFGVNTSRTNPYLLRRCRVSWLDCIAEFRALLEGAGDWYVWVQRAQGMLTR